MKAALLIELPSSLSAVGVRECGIMVFFRIFDYSVLVSRKDNGRVIEKIGVDDVVRVYRKEKDVVVEESRGVWVFGFEVGDVAEEWLNKFEQWRCDNRSKGVVDGGDVSKTVKGDAAKLEDGKLASVRARVVKEILDTEEMYVSYLGIINGNYLERWVKMSNSEAVATTETSKFPPLEVMNSFFPKNFKPIYNFNLVLCKKLKEMVADGKSVGGVGKLFLKYGSFLKMYNDYSSNYHKSMNNFYKALEEYPMLSNELEEIKEVTGLTHTFEDLMIMPVQRVPRYGLLLKELLRNMPEKHPEYAELKAAVDLVQGIVGFINESVRKKEKLDRFETLVHKFPLLSKLIVPTRYLVYDITVKSREQKNTFSRCIFLFNDMLVTARESLIKSGNVDLLSSRHCWPLNLVWFKEGDVSYSVFGPNGGEIVVDNHSKSNQEFFQKVNEVVSEWLAGAVDDVRSGKFSTEDEEYDGEWLLGLKHGHGLLKSPEFTYEGEFRSSKFFGRGKLIHLDGYSYDGEWLDGLQNGYGVLYDRSGAILYEGEWFDGHWNGSGTLIYHPSNIKYTGSFKDSASHDYGELTFPNGSAYCGNWKLGQFDDSGHLKYLGGGGGFEYSGGFQNGMRHGTGTLTYPDHSVYSGEFQGGKRNGNGRMTYSNGLVYEGEWMNDFADGKGQIFFPDGSKYIGALFKGKFKGHGVFSYRNGMVYDGQWSDSRRNGKGKLTLSERSYYLGEWICGRMEGKGTMIFESGAKYEGIWADNLFHKSGIYKGADGDYIKTYDGEWEHGRFSGKGHIVFATGEWYKGGFKCGIFHGNGIWSYPNNVVLTGKWNMGKRFGKFTLTCGLTQKNVHQGTFDLNSNVFSIPYSNIKIHLPPTPPLFWSPPDIGFFDD